MHDPIATQLDVSTIRIPQQQTHGGDPFPWILQCHTAAAPWETVESWLGQRREELSQRVERHGAILFRGFPIDDAQVFDKFVATFGWKNFPYDQSLSNAVRINYTPRVFSANEAPADVTIFLHHEMAQTPVYPGKLFFCCLQSPDEGGATPLCRSDILFDQIAEQCPQFAHDCQSKGLRYTNVMPSHNDANSGMGRSWQSTLRADNPSQAEQRLSKLGYTWEWLDDGCLRATTPVLPAVREVTPGRLVFFNQLIAAHQGWRDSRNDPARSITFGDGTPLDRDAVLQVVDLAEQLSFDVPWQPGDIALIDNSLVMHGRRTFRGQRQVLASLVAP